MAREQFEARIEPRSRSVTQTSPDGAEPHHQQLRRGRGARRDRFGKTYLVYDKLRREGRDSIWAYVARNLSRPLAFPRAAAGRTWSSAIRRGSLFAI